MKTKKINKKEYVVKTRYKQKKKYDVEKTITTNNLIMFLFAFLFFLAVLGSDFTPKELILRNSFFCVSLTIIIMTIINLLTICFSTTIIKENYIELISLKKRKLKK